MRVVEVEFDGREPVGAEAPGLLDDLEYPLVLVVWRDAFFDFDQRSIDERRADYLVRTVGFLLSDGPTFVSLAQEVLPDGEGFRAVTHIPVSLVESLVELAEAPPEASSTQA